MTPGCGNGTLVMTWLRNHSMPRSAARLLTAVGLRRVSIGPPLSVIASGTKGSRSASMIEPAPTPRDHMHVAAEHVQHLDDVIDIVIKIEAALRQRDHPGIGPVGDIDLMARQKGFDRAAQQRRVVTGHRGDDEHPRLRRAQRPCQLAIEIQQAAERLFPYRADFNRRAYAVDFGIVETPFGFAGAAWP